MQKNRTLSQKIPCIPTENLGSLPSENKTLADLVVDCQKPIYFSKRTLFFYKKSPMFVQRPWPRCLQRIQHWQILHSTPQSQHIPAKNPTLSHIFTKSHIFPRKIWPRCFKRIRHWQIRHSNFHSRWVLLPLPTPGGSCHTCEWVTSHVSESWYICE